MEHFQMARPKSDKSNLSNITVRLEEKYISDLNLYAQAVGKNRSEILRSLVIGVKTRYAQNLSLCKVV
jgi:hypothetical protein